MRGRVLWSWMMVALGMVLHASLGAPLRGVVHAAATVFIARVNGAGIPVEDFVTLAARKPPDSPEGYSAEQRAALVDDLVDEELLYQEALKQGLDKDPKVKKVMTNQLLREGVYTQVTNSQFSDAQLQAYFNAHIDEFVVPEKVQIKTITVRFGDERSEAEAKSAVLALRNKALVNPDSFKDLAALSSEDPYARRGGDVGFVAREGKPGLDPRIVDAAFALEVGQLSQPLRLDNAYVLVLTNARRERVERTYEQMKGSVLRKVKNDELGRIYEAYVLELRESATIVVDRNLMLGTEIPVRTLPASFPAVPEESWLPGEAAEEP